MPNCLWRTVPFNFLQRTVPPLIDRNTSGVSLDPLSKHRMTEALSVSLSSLFTTTISETAHTTLGLMSMSHISLHCLLHLALRTNARGHSFHSGRNQNDNGSLLKILFGCAHRLHQKVLTWSGLGCRGVLAMWLTDSTHQSYRERGIWHGGGVGHNDYVLGLL